ncbi:MAG: hypothetical protein AAGA18_06590 [Verrucomicrobiota bacterium]
MKSSSLSEHCAAEKVEKTDHGSEISPRNIYDLAISIEQEIHNSINAYAVYFDLMLADIEGNIVANGRSDLFQSVWSNQAGED